MRKNIHLFFILFLCSITTKSFAQLDGSTGGKNKGNSSFGIITAPAKKIKKPKTLDFNNTNGFKTANSELQKELQKKQAQKDLENKGILTPELLRKITLQKKAEKFNLKIPLIDKDIGSFRTKSKNININAIDFGQVDGDIITVFNNGVPIIKNYYLKHSLKKFKIPLELGFNKIEILAVDEGSLRPNTGAFTIYDDYDEVVISDLWQLARGAKVIALVIREKEQ
ncbi:hypothetical protein Q4517_02975 [Tenacibaculum sp. 1_MG-2023]|uniref:hypothetical protein n=1 Tax=Tenacibaculum sp. 1_MG-2023 TaxID=3062653 RepID=UPI0026E2F0D5|nr:hypothetical protein [Tenacibaculum sp. 1_MG-2023]MDO6674507.1 hypothetical protein [Tenacibaculum sp. 1_MG-2023]